MDPLTVAGWALGVAALAVVLFLIAACVSIYRTVAELPRLLRSVRNHYDLRTAILENKHERAVLRLLEEEDRLTG